MSHLIKLSQKATSDTFSFTVKISHEHNLSIDPIQLSISLHNGKLMIFQIGTAMALTSFSNIYMGTKVNKFFSLNGAVTVNTTLEMEENSYTRSEIVKRDIKNKLIEVIQARANNIGSGNLYVSGPFNPIPGVEDFNECSEPEYNDCGDYSVCVNLFGGFTCECLKVR